MPKRKRKGKRRDRRQLVHPRLWIVLAAPKRPHDNAMWCDVCESWKRKTYRTAPVRNDAGLIATPSYRFCVKCLKANFDGSGLDMIRATTEWTAQEEALLSLITDEQVEAKILSMLGALQRSGRVTKPGFRKGHVPLSVIRRRFQDKLIVAAMEELLIESLNKIGAPAVDHTTASVPEARQTSAAHSQAGPPTAAG